MASHNSPEVERKHARTRQRAETLLVRRHPDEFAEILHEQKHLDGVPHNHNPENPETLAWWGEPTKRKKARAS